MEDKKISSIMQHCLSTKHKEMDERLHPTFLKKRNFGIIKKYRGITLTLNVYIYIYIYIYTPTPPLGQDMTQGKLFKRSLTGLNSEFSFS